MRWRWAAVGYLLFAAGMIQPAAADNAATACQTAGRAAERTLDLPPGLLQAIGRVESGRWDPISGRVAAWPWTINAVGTGRLFEQRDQAIAETRALQARGVTSVDVGCFQVNLFHHPTAFASLEEAFDPQANATYAARFLSALRTRTGNWDSAVAAYHSATPDRGGPYRDRVMATLANADIRQREIALPVRQVAVWTPAQGMGRMRIWGPSVVGQGPSVIAIQMSSDGPRMNLPVVSTRDRTVAP